MTILSRPYDVFHREVSSFDRFLKIDSNILFLYTSLVLVTLAARCAVLPSGDLCERTQARLPSPLTAGRQRRGRQEPHPRS